MKTSISYEYILSTELSENKDISLLTGGDEGSEADLLNMSVLDQTSPRGIGKLRWIGTFIGFGEKKNKGTNERTDKVTTSLLELLIAAKN